MAEVELTVVADDKTIRQEPGRPIPQKALPDGRMVKWVSGKWAGPPNERGDREALVTVSVDGQHMTKKITVTAEEMDRVSGFGLIADGTHRRKKTRRR